jgi:hypothetical protein
MHCLSLTNSFFVIFNLIFIINNDQINAQSSFCLNFPINPGPFNFPQLPNKYQARVEVNYVNEKRTSDMYIYYDSSKNRASIEIREKNTIKTLIFNYDTDEIYQLTCIWLFLLLKFRNIKIIFFLFFLKQCQKLSQIKFFL